MNIAQQVPMLEGGDGYVLTYTGKRFYPTFPESLEVDIVDIAHALSNVCRYNGHLKSFLSVAQHSCYVARYVEENYNKHLALAALLHDASEAYLPDMPSPIKDTLPDFRKLEARLHKHIFNAFNLDWPYAKIIKEVDKVIRQDEMRDLSDWDLGGKGLEIAISSWEPWLAEKLFLERYEELNTAPNRKAQ